MDIQNPDLEDGEAASELSATTASSSMEHLLEH
jgi:hypothetical protein